MVLVHKLDFLFNKKKYNFLGITNVVERKTDLRDTEYIHIYIFYRNWVLVILSSRLFSTGISGRFFSTNLTNPERIKYLGLFFRKNTAIARIFSSLGAFSKYVCWFFHGQIFPSISPQWETTIKFICLSTHKKTSKIFPIASSEFLWYPEING